MVFVDPPLGHIQYPMEKVSANALSYPERLRIVIFVTQLFFPMRHPFDGFKLVPAHHAILGVVAIGPYAALYPSARMLQMGTRPPPPRKRPRSLPPARTPLAGPCPSGGPDQTALLGEAEDGEEDRVAVS